ncbi:MAG: hypothetical protein IJ859_00175 [Synergistaceae bacterium]|nr:hypothetical protein [Synergistaceae bacterium]
MKERMYDERIDFCIEEGMGKEIVGMVIKEVLSIGKRSFTICGEISDCVELLAEFEKQGANVRGLIHLENSIEENGAYREFTYPAIQMKISNRLKYRRTA